MSFGAFYCKRERGGEGERKDAESKRVIIYVLLEDVRRSQDYYSSQGLGRTVKHSTCTKVRGGGAMSTLLLPSC